MFTHGEKSLTKENLFKLVDSYQLFKFYCPRFNDLGEMFSSEFRKDEKPSCHIIYWNGDLLYKDFGGESYRILDYISKKFGLNFTQTLKKINDDLGLGLGYSANNGSETKIVPVILDKSPEEYRKRQSGNTIIEIQPRDWTKFDKKYWNSYQIPLSLLEEHNIKSISHYRISNAKLDNAFYRINPFMLAYSIDYYWNEGVFRRKLYFPQSKSARFISNVDYTIVQGWSKLPKEGGDILLVTKSYKDILIFALLGYYAIAPNNEFAAIPERVMEKLKRRWKHIYVWFDNDESGIKGAKLFCDKFDLRMFHNPLGEPKDPSDYVQKYNLDKFRELIQNFLRNATE